MKRLSLESRMRLLTMRLPNGCHQWLGLPSMKIRVNGRLRDVRKVAAALSPEWPTWRANEPCPNKRCINPEHQVCP